MASDPSSPRYHARRQSIPLQDLSRPPDSNTEDAGETGHTRGVGARTRSLLGNRHSFSGRLNTTYERVDEGSPPAHDRQRLDLPTHATTPRSAHHTPYYYEDGEASPVNKGDFAVAMGSVGLSFDSVSHSTSPRLGARSSITASTLGVISEAEDGISPFSRSVNHLSVDDQNESYFPPTDDSTPLTDINYLQPISGAPGHDRKNSVFSFQEAGSRLGDDLPNTDGGVRRSPSSAALHRLSSHLTRAPVRALSASMSASPLSRAGSMMRKMSQRVVNLSNEPEVVEQSMRRQSSSKGARLEEPPSFPAMAEYAHDEPLSAPPENVKPAGNTQEEESRAHNPLRGKSLYIFSPDNWIRLKLCEMLVHPVTEPVILVLIVIQTVLLAVDSAHKINPGERSTRWVNSRIDLAMLVLFSIYTIELAARTIVSGFIINAKEYSSAERSLGSKDTIVTKIQNLFTPQRASSTSNGANPTTSADFQPSILRSFTTMQAQAGQSGSSRQQQQNRLARRAFLRHSFPRLDFVAVISYWVSFVLSQTQNEPTRFIYVFQMLSSLRILRLLNLTSGTSVSNIHSDYRLFSVLNEI